MAGKRSGAMERAMRAYRKGARNVYRLASKFGLDASSIYKALKSEAKIVAKRT